MLQITQNIILEIITNIEVIKSFTIPLLSNNCLQAGMTTLSKNVSSGGDVNSLSICLLTLYKF